VHGETATERPCRSLHSEVDIMSLHATIFTLMGISPKTSYEIEKRPFYVTKDGLGVPVDAVIA
jgi:hypothetical protein